MNKAMDMKKCAGSHKVKNRFITMTIYIITESQILQNKYRFPPNGC